MTDPSPQTEPQPKEATRPLLRGLGVLSGVATFGFVGLVDGSMALHKAPRGAVAGHLAVLVVLHCVAVLVSLGIFFGALEELLLESARRVPVLARLGAWASLGPRGWFARDPDSATGVMAGVMAVAIIIGPIFPATYLISLQFHSHFLAAVAVLLIVVVSTIFAAVWIALTAAPLRWVLTRCGRVASPGTIITLALIGLVGQWVRFIRLNWAIFQNLDLGFAAIGLALIVGNIAALIALGARVRRTRRPVGRRSVLIVAALAIAAFWLSALTFGARQTVAATIFNRSVVTQYLVRGLQVAIDLDRDGYSPVFGGGDCNDHNRRVNPGAADIPGNGVDENCSGRDARVETDETDGRMVTLTGPLATGPQPSIVLISIDAMRPDHMGIYGYRRPTTPNIDAFARGAARFTNAYCASPRSLRSFSSIWTGRYASLISWGNDIQFPPLSDSNVTLAEILRDGGYLTAAFLNVHYFSRTNGFFQGFGEFHEGREFKDDSGPAVNNLMEFIRAHRADERPFMTWIHMMEPHDPYTDRERPRDFGHEPMDQYDEEIAHADELAAPLLALIDEVSRDRPIITIIMGDHGEAFGEHGVYHHSFDLHDEALRVPLIIKGPSIAPGPRQALANLFDLHPTLLNFARLQTGASVSGRSLVSVLLDPRPQSITFPGWRDHLYGEVIPDGFYPTEQKSLYAPPYKLIHDLRRGTWELFDISRDRGEIANLYDDRADLAVQLRERLLSWADAGALMSNRSAEIIAAARLTREPVMQHPVHVRFGDVMELLGYDLESNTVPVGGTIHATMYYRVLRRTRYPVWMTIMFQPLDNGGQYPYFHARHYPLYGRYPTTEWNAGEILRDEISRRVDLDVRPTRMRVEFSMEINPTMERIPPTTRSNQWSALDLGEIEVVPAPPPAPAAAH